MMIHMVNLTAVHPEKIEYLRCWTGFWGAKKPIAHPPLANNKTPVRHDALNQVLITKII